MDLKRLKEKFIKNYGRQDIRCFFSPSRVNIIGEHIDYNGGKVLPGAIEIGTYGVVSKRDDNILRLASENMDLKVEVSLEDLKYEKSHGWANYPKGVIYFLKEAGYYVGGMDILIEGNIPNGAGLSSSASLELLVAEIVNKLFNNGKIDRLELVKISQKAENEFVGVNCGIMDQFAIGMGKKDKAILLDTDTLDYRYVDINFEGHTLVIMNTNKRRELSDSKYNERRSECEEGLKLLKKFKDINHICDLSIDEFEDLKDNIKKENIRNRVEHVVYENYRVNRAIDALEDGDIDLIGELLNKSHESLKNLYEVTGKELDTIVEAANSLPQTKGARMIGAGFGGSAIAIVEKTKVEEFIQEVKERYKKEIGLIAEMYISDIGDGTREMTKTGI